MTPGWFDGVPRFAAFPLCSGVLVGWMLLARIVWRRSKGNYE